MNGAIIIILSYKGSSLTRFLSFVDFELGLTIESFEFGAWSER